MIKRLVYQSLRSTSGRTSTSSLRTFDRCARPPTTPRESRRSRRSVRRSIHRALRSRLHQDHLGLDRLASRRPAASVTRVCTHPCPPRWSGVPSARTTPSRPAAKKLVLESIVVGAPGGRLRTSRSPRPCRERHDRPPVSAPPSVRRSVPDRELRHEAVPGGLGESACRGAGQVRSLALRQLGGSTVTRLSLVRAARSRGTRFARRHDIRRVDRGLVALGERLVPRGSPDPGAPPACTARVPAPWRAHRRRHASESRSRASRALPRPPSRGRRYGHRRARSRRYRQAFLVRRRRVDRAIVADRRARRRSAVPPRRHVHDRRKSCTLAPRRTTIGLKSPRSTACTRPRHAPRRHVATITAVGAMNAWDSDLDSYPRADSG